MVFINNLKNFALNHIKEEVDKKAFEKEIQNLRLNSRKNFSAPKNFHQYIYVLRI